ncbi:MAG: AzlD domain-containing protein [Polaromonas sp.]|nr:AzlD domain-containing protein [Polaromonas sp.]
MNQTDLWTVGTIIGLTLVTVVTRAFFFFSSKPWSPPQWVQRGMDYAPIAALAAVVVPEIVMTQGMLVATLKDARIVAAVVGAAWYYWRRGVLGTIASGMAVYLPLHLGLGW